MDRFDSMKADFAIQVNALKKIYAGHPVLSEVNLAVRPGEAVALLGANGAGKTTLLRILATLSRPSRGTAIVAGHDCVKHAERVREAVGFVAHGAWVYDDLTALENLKFWTTLSGRPTHADALRVALTAVDLDRFAHARVRTFSVGMKRRLALARLTLGRPRVILLDEPFAGLDQQAGKWVDEYLAAFKAGGGSVLLTTHSFGRGLGVADRIVILADGTVALDTPAATLSPDDVRRLYEAHAEDDA
jgi:heme ABC exporter ATP-binding subunit CcmA